MHILLKCSLKLLGTSRFLKSSWFWVQNSFFAQDFLSDQTSTNQDTNFLKIASWWYSYLNLNVWANLISPLTKLSSSCWHFDHGFFFAKWDWYINLTPAFADFFLIYIMTKTSIKTWIKTSTNNYGIISYFLTTHSFLVNEWICHFYVL